MMDEHLKMAPEDKHHAHGLLVAVIAIACLYGAYALGSYQNMHQAEQVVMDKLAMVANIVATDHEAAISGVRQFLISTSYFITELPNSSAICDDVLRRMHVAYPYFLNVGIADNNGKIVCSGVAVPRNTSLAGDEDFERLLASKSFTVSDYRISQSTGRPSVRFMQPILGNDDGMIGTLFIVFGVEWLNGFSPAFNLPQDVVITKFDRSGTVFMRYPNPVAWSGTNQAESGLFSVTKSNEPGYVRSRGLDNVSRLYYYRPIYLDGDVHAYVFTGAK